MSSIFIFPQPWVSWTPSGFTGFSVNPSGGVYRYQRNGQLVTLAIRQPNNGTGTSNDVVFTITGIPFTAATIANMTWIGYGSAFDNGTQLPTPTSLLIGSGGTIIQIQPAPNGGNWTNSGIKRLAYGTITYEIA